MRGLNKGGIIGVIGHGVLDLLCGNDSVLVLAKGILDRGEQPNEGAGGACSPSTHDRRNQLGCIPRAFGTLAQFVEFGVGIRWPQGSCLLPETPPSGRRHIGQRRAASFRRRFQQNRPRSRPFEIG